MHRFLKILVLLIGLLAVSYKSQAQRYTLFSEDVKTDFPSVVFDFLERYLYEIDSLERQGEPISQRLMDDKVTFRVGSPSVAGKVTPETRFTLNTIENRLYDVSWCDSLGIAFLEMSFPMQYDLILGKNKIVVEKELKKILCSFSDSSYFPCRLDPDAKLIKSENGCYIFDAAKTYYVESLNTTAFFKLASRDKYSVIFEDNDRWHSSANLFQGYVSENIDGYKLYIEQSLYGFKKTQFTISLKQWLAYCQAMHFTTYFAVEEERQDGLKALLIAQSPDLGFNHILSLVIPNDFVRNRKTVIKGKLNAYIPMQNVKDLYKEYVARPKKRIL